MVFVMADISRGSPSETSQCFSVNALGPQMPQPFMNVPRTRMMKGKTVAMMKYIRQMANVSQRQGPSDVTRVENVVPETVVNDRPRASRICKAITPSTATRKTELKAVPSGRSDGYCSASTKIRVESTYTWAGVPRMSSVSKDSSAT